MHHPKNKQSRLYYYLCLDRVILIVFFVCVFLQIVDLHFHHVQQNPICADVFLFELSISQKTRGGFGPEQTEQINVEVMVVG